MSKNNIERITEYENIFNRAKELLADGQKSDELGGLIKQLETYYASDEWKSDFADDEAGKLPPDLRRGVLSEDGIYNLLDEYAALPGEKHAGGSNAGRAVVYIHGKGGSAQEAEHYRPLFPLCEVCGLDYNGETPWDAGRDIHRRVEEIAAEYGRVILIANSIGAFFAMNADIEDYTLCAFFISPVVDMEKMICGMMLAAGVTEAELESEGVIHTEYGEDLSWDYLRFVRSHPLSWNVPTEVLYAGGDAIVPACSIDDFVRNYNAGLTVMEKGEHWFHTPEQLMFLDGWIRKKKEFLMNNSDFIIRAENAGDYRETENLVREAFWNVYRPGCSEHYVIHVLRDDPAFVKELDFVMESGGKLIGQNMFMKTVIEADDGRTVPVLTMGPICITPALKRKGYGKKLLDYSLEKAAALGFGAVLFEGNIDFYGKSGFTFARNFGIRYHDLPEDADDSFFLCRELIPGYLDNVTGVYQTPQGYYVDDADVEEFDKAFPPKEKLKLPGQLFD